MRPVFLGIVGILVSVWPGMAVATVYAKVNGTKESNDHNDGSQPSHLSKVTYTMVTSGPFEAKVTRVDIGGRPPPGELWTSNEVWGSKGLEYRKWTGSKCQTVRKYNSKAWYMGGEPTDLQHVYDGTDVSLPGGALVKHRNKYGWYVNTLNCGLNWSEWSGRSRHKHFLQDY